LHTLANYKSCHLLAPFDTASVLEITSPVVLCTCLALANICAWI
jgi:hypothetical protein